jgi:RNA polymerase sigma-70 factor (ECF subfamily)
VADLRGWLITVVARICLDVLRSARVRRESYVGPWLPEPLVSRLPAEPPDPAETAVRTEQVGLALLVVLDRLTPEQRVAFVLHDVFEVPFDAIAATLGTSPGNARQLAARARQAVRDRGPVTGPPEPRADQRRVLAAFLRAAAAGDLPGLARVLAPDVELIGDGGGLAPALTEPLVGAERVGRFLIGLFRRAQAEPRARGELVLVNDALGLLVEWAELRLIIAPQIRGDRIVASYHILNPNKLTRVGPPDPATASWPPIVHTG